MWWKSWHANTKKLIANIYLQCYIWLKHTLPCIYYSCTQGHHRRGARGAHVLCHFVCSSWFPVVTDLPSPPLHPCIWACKCAHTHRQKVVSTPQHFSTLFKVTPMKTFWRHPCHHNTDASASFRHLSAFLHVLASVTSTAVPSRYYLLLLPKNTCLFCVLLQCFSMYWCFCKLQCVWPLRITVHYGHFHLSFWSETDLELEGGASLISRIIVNPLQCSERHQQHKNSQDVQLLHIKPKRQLAKRKRCKCVLI